MLEMEEQASLKAPVSEGVVVTESRFLNPRQKRKREENDGAGMRCLGEANLEGQGAESGAAVHKCSRTGHLRVLWLLKPHHVVLQPPLPPPPASPPHLMQPTNIAKRILQIWHSLPWLVLTRPVDGKLFPWKTVNAAWLSIEIPPVHD